MSKQAPSTGERWTHHKTGRTYIIVSGRALLEVNLAEMVVYTDGNTTWIRPMAEFVARFSFTESP